MRATNTSQSGSVSSATPELIDAEAVAQLLSVSPATLYRLASAGKLPRPIKLGSRITRYRRSEITAWIAAGCPDRSEWEKRLEFEGRIRQASEGKPGTTSRNQGGPLPIRSLGSKTSGLPSPEMDTGKATHEAASNDTAPR